LRYLIDGRSDHSVVWLWIFRRRILRRRVTT
jgi:hypothetical protein